MMRREKFTIANIYVPVKRRATLKQLRNIQRNLSRLIPSEQLGR
jgi:hypothetical protein